MRSEQLGTKKENLAQGRLLPKYLVQIVVIRQKEI